MNEYETILCLCPAKRLSAATLVLSTWSAVRRFVLTDDVRLLEDAGRYSAVLVMDRFVDAQVVRRAAALRPVIVLAWNGLFDIARYRQVVGDLDVLYLGTGDSLPGDVATRHRPMINGDCAFASWLDLYLHKRQFVVHGAARYRAQLVRTLLLPSRAANLAISAMGAVHHPHTLVRTLASGFVRHKLVWAGQCHLDYPSLGLSDQERDLIQRGIQRAREEPTPAQCLRRTADLIEEWSQFVAGTMGSERAHLALYVTNTLLRWGALNFLRTTAAPWTWFFGNDNTGLGLGPALYLHNLVPNSRVAYLELGGTRTFGRGLYPRSLHLLAREFYVIPMLESGEPEHAITAVERLGQALLHRPREFFDALERRRRAIYSRIVPANKLAEVHESIWGDYGLCRELLSVNPGWE